MKKFMENTERKKKFLIYHSKCIGKSLNVMKIALSSADKS